ncbi:hypothetical protein GCM10010371_34400 [Streptomyces subrutilus]|uniref:Uncharacterized protein n=1 Tax=Streptomyces subrutilus TaxID=36818 RepID=A0A918QUJ8_9ACTN|nr:hypothetical protein [Streptomyces subrutilus]GGZ71824.1 hypothetical protein GCM10010371_34400 [Streptomyces subrutilus]
MLAWTGPGVLAGRDDEQIGLLLTGHASTVASDVRPRRSAAEGQWARALAYVVLRGVEGRLSATPESTVR